jgi:hypothetical protein
MDFFFSTRKFRCRFLENSPK